MYIYFSLLDRLLDINFGCITSGGNISPSPDIGMTIPIACQEGDIFKISNYLTDVTSPTSVSSRGVILNSNFQILQQLPVINSYTPEYSMPANAAYVSFNYMTPKSSELIIERIFSPIIISKLPKSIIYGENVLKGKRWVSFGDSLTYRNLWQPYVLSEIALEHTNCGIGSTFLSGTSSTAFWQNSRLDVVKAADPEIITILGGANDLTQDSPIGTDAEFDAILSSKNTSNFKGAYSYIIENLLTWKPSLKIIILTTSFAHLGGAAYSPSGNMRYYMYADASREVAYHYGLPVVDLYREMGINKLTQSVYTSDTIHWNDAGAKVVASLVISKIKEIINK